MPIPPTTLERLVEAARLAPSSHNTQPWRFVATPEGLDLRADRGRGLPVNDPLDRELTLSCGCALANLEAAATALGLSPRVEPFPDGAATDRLARIRLGTTVPDAGAEVPAAIALRCTHRGEVAAGAPGAALQARLVAAADRLGARLHVLQGEARVRAASLVERGDRAQWDDARWRRELALWLRERPAADGLAVPGPVAPLARALVRAADLGAVIGPRDGEGVRDAPWLGLLATRDDDPPAWLAAGRALQAILLEAADAGFQAAYFNQPVQVDSLRPMLGSLCPGAHPHVLFRLGRPIGTTRPTARRPVADVLDLPEASTC